jgi:Mn2+/Fe2+ NRAMP family transporter
MPLLQRLRNLGPGLILAAAGIGAGDVVVASVTGIKFGPTLLWAIAVTAALKFVLTEGLARWHLAAGETIARAQVTRFPRWVSILFAAYLLFWTFLVGSLANGAGSATAPRSSLTSFSES